jgi:integrase
MVDRGEALVSRRLCRPASICVQAGNVPSNADILAATDGSIHSALYAVDLSLGLRLGELTGLRWSNVDLDQRSLHVRSQLQRGQMVPLERIWHGRTLMLSPGLANVAERMEQVLRPAKTGVKHVESAQVGRFELGKGAWRRVSQILF